MKSVRGIAIAHCIAFCLVAPLAACPSDDAAESGDAAAATAGDEPCWADQVGLGSDGSSNPLQETWGAACTSDADCVALIGEGGICQFEAVIFGLPGGYCSKPCVLPDETTRVLEDSPECDPNGGVACIGQKGFYEFCALVCTDDMQCTRDGYDCRQMPLIANPDDPKSCLMPDCCEGACGIE